MIAVTGATGHLGRRVVEELLGRGVAAGEIAALVRSPEKAGDLAERGVQVRAADYAVPASLGPALDGVEKLLLVSANVAGPRRVEEHRNVVDAARAAGVRLLAYTSILRADTGTTMLARDHRATEEIIRASGIPFVFLRNGWYLENYTGGLGRVVEQGVLAGSADEGRVSAAARADFAAAAAAVLAGSGHENQVYELGGEAFTLPVLAATIARVSGRPVRYQDMPEAEYTAALLGAGLPEPVARLLADSDRGVAQGELYTDRDDLRRLIGRAPTTAGEAVAAALQGGENRTGS